MMICMSAYETCLVGTSNLCLLNSFCVQNVLLDLWAAVILKFPRPCCLRLIRRALSAGYPSELYYRGSAMWETLYGMILAYPIVMFVFVPVYYSLGITSVYQVTDTASVFLFNY